MYLTFDLGGGISQILACGRLSHKPKFGFKLGSYTGMFQTASQ